MTRSARDLVNSHLANQQPNVNARPATPEPTTQSGVEVGHALYDTPPPGGQSAEYVEGPRKPKPSSRGKKYRETFELDEAKRLRSNNTRARNATIHTQSQVPGNNHSTQGPQPRSRPLPKACRKGKSKGARNSISRSPSPGSTDCEPEEPTQPQTANPQYTYETLDHEGLIKYAKEKFNLNVCGCSTQAIFAMLWDAEGRQAPQMGLARQPASIVMPPGARLNVGRKRGSDGSDVAENSTKRRHLATLVDDWATEDESDYGSRKRHVGPVQVAAERILQACSPNVPSNSTRPAQPGTCPPPPSHQTTPPTVPASPALQSSSIGTSTSQGATSVPQLPMLLSTPRGPVHARLRGRLFQRYSDAMDRDAEAAIQAEEEVRAEEEAIQAEAEAAIAEEEAAQAAAEAALAEAEAAQAEIEAAQAEVEAAQAEAEVAQAWEETDKEIDELQPTDDEVNELEPTDNEEPDLGVLTMPGRQSGAQHTYAGTRSHAPPISGANMANPAEEDDDLEGPIERPNLPSLTSAQLIRRERARAAAAKALAEVGNMSGAHCRPRIIAQATQPPTTRPQAHPQAPTPNTGIFGARTQGNRRLDPVTTAHADIVAFNKATAQSDDDEPDEGMHARAEAFANKKWPTSRGCNRKPKPLARDVSGVERKVLIMAKLHLFAYALAEGIYENRPGQIQWGMAVHRATWAMELLGIPYHKPDHEIFEILVNNIATVRGKARDRCCPFTITAAGFQQSLTNQQVIQENLRRFHLIYPNSFHCKNFSPREGHYENPEIAHCIAVMLFHGPNSVGAMYPDYFVDMPLPVVAFVLAVWQFCIEEWSNGWHQNCDLSAGAMREKYEAQLAGLKELRNVAPRCMSRLQDEWRDYVVQYSGTQFTDEKDVEAEDLHQSEMRPDTPEPDSELDAMSIEEMNAQLMETARQASLRERMCEIITREQDDLSRAGTPMDIDDPRAETPDSARSRSPTPPPAEYNKHGCLTARSKGKGRAT
ncbi:hypothetical protein FS749_015245 [Ceratobasidium sp. UAMH 11750]|nr:hypothetical protein FS749_015245 [Ceratobasidium sp. UAMH 11750]